MAAGFHYFFITRHSLIEYAYHNMANILAHYSSVYSDGISGKIAYLNLEAGRAAYSDIANDMDVYLMKLSQVQYDIENVTQNLDEKYQIWHCCRNNHSTFSSSERVLQSGNFAWEKLFFSARLKKINDLRINTPEIKAIGQSLHAFQDIIVHRGARYNADIIDEHDELLDAVPGKDNILKMKYITKNAIRIYRLLSNDKPDELLNSEISVVWMNDDQVHTLKESIGLTQKSNLIYRIGVS